jgi:hypothetical protein
MRDISEVIMLVGQILVIACVQLVVEALIDKDKKPELAKLLSLACYAGALMLVLRFIFARLLPEISTLFRTSFY